MFSNNFCISCTANLNNKMYRTIKIIIFTLCVCESTLIKKILKLNASKVCVVKNADRISYDSQINLVLKKVAPEIPSIIIDNEAINVLNDNKKADALNSDLLIVLENSRTFSVKKLNTLLKMIAKLNPLPPRPKCLVILINYSNKFDAKIQRFLSDAWSLKYLDFSILIINHHDSTILSYNPFFKNYSYSSTELFPDKLRNMNGHKIRTILHNKPPHIEFSQYRTINGMNWAFWKLTSSALNFDFKYVEIHNRSDLPDNHIFEMVERGNIDTSITMHSLGIQITKAHCATRLIFFIC